MRSIRFKILLIGAVSTILMMTTAIIVSYFLYYKGARQQFLKKVDNAIEQVTYDLGRDDINSELTAVREYIIENYTEEEKVFETFDDKKTYYKEKYSQLYPAGSGSFGFSRLTGDFITVVSYLKSEAIATNSTVYFCIVDWENYNLIYLADSRDGTDVEYYLPGESYNFKKDIGTYVKQNEENGLYDIIEFNNKTCKIVSIPIANNNFTFVVEYDLSSTVGTTNSFLVNILIFFSIGVVVLLLIYYFFVHHFIIKNVIELKKSHHEFKEGLYNGKLEVINPNIKTNDEIKDLSNSFVELENEIKNYSNKIEEETKKIERINTELNVASKIQLESLPNNIYIDNNIELYSKISSAKEVGGDFYDYFYIDDNNFAVIISDVSGKGIPASLFMMRCKELIKSKLLTKMKIDDVCYMGNNELLDNNKEGLFITAFIGVYNIKDDLFTYVNCGHEKPYLISDKIEKLETDSNFILGGIKDFKYNIESIKLNNRKVFLHTDGLNESVNKEKLEFSYENIIRVLNDNKFENDNIILENMLSELNIFTNSSEQFDDITMLIFNTNNNLLLEYSNPDYEIIEETIKKFEEKYFEIDNDNKSKISIIIDEILNNYISYEKKDDLIIKINFIKNNNYIDIIFKNNGKEFNPLIVPEKHIETGKEEIGGLGLTIVKNFVEEISYSRIDNFNVLYLKKKI